MIQCFKCKQSECTCAEEGMLINESTHTVKRVSITIPKLLTIEAEVNGRAKLHITGVDIECEKQYLVKILRDVQQACQIAISKVE